MIDIPTETLGNIFDKHFNIGSVWLYKNFLFHSTGKKRNKYIIILNPKAADNQAYFTLPTSQVEKIMNNVTLYKDSFVISKGCSEIFPIDTIVVVSNIESISFDDIRSSYISKPFPQRIEYRGTLDNTIMIQLIKLAKSSKRISPKILKLIFPTS